MYNEDPLGLMISIELTYWSLENFSLENITYWQPQSHTGLLKNKDKDVIWIYMPPLVFPVWHVPQGGFIIHCSRLCFPEWALTSLWFLPEWDVGSLGRQWAQGRISQSVTEHPVRMQEQRVETGIVRSTENLVPSLLQHIEGKAQASFQPCIENKILFAPKYSTK